MDYCAKRCELKVLMASSRQAYFRRELASTNDSGRIWRILRKEGLTVDKNNLSCNSFTAQELNTFYSAVACAHPPCPPNSLDEIAASIQFIGTLCFHEITTADVYETARMLSSKSKGQSPDGLPWKYLESTVTIFTFFS